MAGFFQKVFESSRSIKVIDYGCGSGYLLKVLPHKRINKYWGLETSVPAIESAKVSIKKRNVSFLFVDTKKTLKLPSKKVDVVVAIGVLQYMTDNQINEFINQSSKVLKKGGHLLISCVSDHLIYKLFNLYGLVLPNRFIRRNWILNKILSNSFGITKNFEKGLFFGPLFYHNLVIFFDVLDKIIFQTKGTLGMFGKASRKIAYFIASLEYVVPIDFGYTLYIDAVKK